MADANSKQVEYWNGPGGTRWVQSQTTMDALFDRLGRRVLEAARLHAGEDVLDVGTGAGALALQATAEVGPRGLVVGVDISAPLLARARERAAKSPGRVRFEQADAQSAGFGGRRFDAVVSRLGVMFFDDPVRAFTNLAGTLRLGGRLAFACWQAMSENPWIFASIAAATGIVEIPEEDPVAPGPFAFADAARVRAILEGAGFSAIQIASVHEPLAVGTSIEEASALLVTMGPVGRALANASESVRVRVTAELAARLAPFTSARGVVVPSSAWLVTARQATP